MCLCNENARRDRKRAWDPAELELQAAEGAEKETQFLWRSSKCSGPPSPLAHLRHVRLNKAFKIKVSK